MGRVPISSFPWMSEQFSSLSTIPGFLKPDNRCLVDSYASSSHLHSPIALLLPWDLLNSLEQMKLYLEQMERVGLPFSLFLSNGY